MVSRQYRCRVAKNRAVRRCSKANKVKTCSRAIRIAAKKCRASRKKGRRGRR